MQEFPIEPYKNTMVFIGMSSARIQERNKQ